MDSTAHSPQPRNFVVQHQPNVDDKMIDRINNLDGIIIIACQHQYNGRMNAEARRATFNFMPDLYGKAHMADLEAHLVPPRPSNIFSPWHSANLACHCNYRIHPMMTPPPHGDGGVNNVVYRRSLEVGP